MKTLSDRMPRPASIEYYAPSPGHAPDYFDHLRAVVRRAARKGITHLLIVPYARISDPRPGKRETTTDQLRTCKSEIASLEKEFGVTLEIIGQSDEAVSGWKFKKRERRKLVKAANLAREKNAVLVAFDGSRFVRNEDCRFGALPTEDDFKQLMRLVGNVQLATIASPEIHEDRSRSVKRGHKDNNSKPGCQKLTRAGDKKRRRM
jgi:hypothetical protein